MQQGSPETYERGGIEYYNGVNAALRIGVAGATWQALKKQYGLKSIKFPGIGGLFYRKQVIDLIANSTADQLEQIKAQIAELQEQK